MSFLPTFPLQISLMKALGVVFVRVVVMFWFLTMSSLKEPMAPPSR